MTSSEPTSFGATLRRLRLAAGMTQEALAERAGMSAGAISELERNPSRQPRLDSVALLADALELDQADRDRLLATARPDRSLVTATTSSPAIPRPLTPLFGRDGVAAAIADLLQSGVNQLITLTGPGGVGKTRLALEVATRVEADFADGAVFVDLAPLRDPGLVLPTIATRLGLEERDAASLDRQMAAFLNFKRFLLILDNFEHVMAARDAVLALMETCPRLVVLATSRAAMRVRGEREYRVAPLELPDETASPGTLSRSAATAFFLDRAQAVGMELAPNAETAVVVAAICRRLDGLPLAIELTAALTRVLPPSALLERLERRLNLLVGGPHDLPDRQRTMRGAIAWSYDLLDESERRLFRRLSVFAGGCTMEAAEVVSADFEEAPSTMELVAALVDKSFLRQAYETLVPSSEPRLMMLETLREYGRERLDDSGEVEACQKKHAAYYLALAEDAASELNGKGGAAWSERLETEHDNLRVALRWAIDCGNSDIALRIASALWRFWSARGHLSEGRRWLRESLCLPIDPERTTDFARSNALVGAASLAIQQAAFDDAASLCAEAVALARERESATRLMTALNTQGLMMRLRDEYREAARCHEEARAVAEALGEPEGVAAALVGLAYVAAFTGDVAGADKLFDQAVSLLREGSDLRGLAEALAGAAVTSGHAGEFARAEKLGGESLGLLRALGDIGRVADTLWMLGVVAQFQGKFDDATALHDEALALYSERGDEHGIIQALGALGQIALRLADYTRARLLFDEALATARRRDDRWGQAVTLIQLGLTELATGATARASAQLSESVILLKSIGNPLYISWCLEGMAGVAAARGEWPRAARLCGARDAHIARLGAELPAAHPEGYQRTVESIRAALDERTYEAEHEVGSCLTPEQIFAEMTPAGEPAGL